MNILNINKYYFIKGGAERFFFELSKLLERKGHKVIPFSMMHRDNYNSIYNNFFLSEVQTQKVSISWQGLRTVFRFFWSFSAQKNLSKLISKNKIDFAIIHNIYHQISPSILPVLKRNNIPVVLIAHDYALLSPNYGMFVRGKIYDKICGNNFLTCIIDKCVGDSYLVSLVSSLETWFHHSILDVYTKNIAIILAPSQFMKKMFLKAAWPKRKVLHLPYFIQKPKTKLIKTKDSAKRHNVSSVRRDKNYILYFGRLSSEKGINILIEAIKNLPEIKLKIVGDGPERKNCRLQVMKYQLKTIEMFSWKSGEALNKIIANAKFIVVPSEWYENYPLSVLEAYSMGVPALVANIGGLPEMIPNNDNNFLFRPGNVSDLTNKIRSLWDNQKLLDLAGVRVKLFIKEHNDADMYYESLMEIFRRIESNDHRPSRRHDYTL